MADTIAPTFADWLKAAALYATSARDASIYGTSAIETEIISPLALKADAIEEAARQLDTLGGPLAIDEHVLAGRLSGLIGRVITLQGDRLGYETGPRVFVVGASEQPDGSTNLTVLKRL